MTSQPPTTAIHFGDAESLASLRSLKAADSIITKRKAVQINADFFELPFTQDLDTIENNKLGEVK